MAVLNPPKLPPMIINGTKTNKYVCTYKNIWNAEKKMSYRKSSGSVGKYIPIAEDGSYGEIIFNDDFIEKYPSLKYFKVFRRKGGKFEFKPIDEEQFTVEQRSTTSKLHGGATWVLNKVVSESPIGRALAKTFKERNLDKKILSLIYFLCINKDNALSNYEEFAECTWLPFSRPLKSYSISRLLKTITQERLRSF